MTLKPRELWPSQIPRARINATRLEWYRICEVLFQRGIIETIPYDSIFKVGGTPVLNGAFAVEKRGRAGAGQTRVTRLIMNFVPTNAYQRLMRGDLDTLASSTAWCQLVLKKMRYSCGQVMIRKPPFTPGSSQQLGDRLWPSVGLSQAIMWDLAALWNLWPRG